MLNSEQLKTRIIKPALEDLLMYSDIACELLLFTCANESNGGTYVHQIDGPALGIYQMEPSTYNDLWVNFINNDNSLKLRLLHTFNAPVMPFEERLMYDLRFATAMARIQYARFKEALPESVNPSLLWNYYKTYYNTSLGKANYQETLNKYLAFKK